MVLLLVGVALTILVEPLLATVGLSSSIVPISFGMLEMTLSNVTTLTAAPWLASFCCETSISHAKARRPPRDTSGTFALFAALRETFPRFATSTS